MGRVGEERLKGMKDLVGRESYRADVDGLRAMAVVPVILFHAGLGCPGGYVGVDVFFVISGYLITKIIERDLEQKRFSVMKFYQRRVRRIFPALFAMFLVCVGVGVYLLPPAELRDLGKTLIAAAGFCSNILFSRHAGYFDTSSAFQPLLHTWTLSVEEQFYIFWPWMLAAMSLGLLMKWKLPVLAVIALGSLLLSVYWVNHLPNAAFYLLPSRAWELALGAMLSIAPVPRLLERVPRRVADVASLLGLAMLVVAIVGYDGLTPFPGFAAMLPCAGAALVIAAGEGGGTPGGRILSLPPLAWTGLISYSLYLWHWPILAFARILFNRELRTWECVGLVGLIFVVAWMSWRFVETPFRNARTAVGSSRPWVLGGLTTSVVFIGIGAVLFLSGGLPERSPEVARWVDEQEKEADTVLMHSPCLVWGAALPPVQGCLFGAGTFNTNTLGASLLDRDGEALGYSVVLWGDSHAAHLAPALEEIGEHLGVTIREISKAGCPPLPGIRFFPANAMTMDCPAFNGAVLNEILGDKQIRVVVLAARWIALAEGKMAMPMTGLNRNASDSRQLFIWSLEKTIEALVKSGRQVVIVGQVPEPGVNPVACLGRARFHHWSETPCVAMSAKRVAEVEAVVNQSLSAAVNGNAGVHVVHLYELLCGEERCEIARGGQLLYWDGTHLSVAGARWIENGMEKGVGAAMGITEISESR